MSNELGKSFSAKWVDDFVAVRSKKLVCFLCGFTFQPQDSYRFFLHIKQYHFEKNKLWVKNKVRHEQWLWKTTPLFMPDAFGFWRIWQENKLQEILKTMRKKQ